jgi:transcriptional regulator with XRE-family HTH domain
MTSLAERVKTAREGMGMTQSDLARAAGVKPGTIAFIENGTTRNPIRLLDIARALNRSPRWLMDGVEDAQNGVVVEKSAHGPGNKMPFPAFESSSQVTTEVAHLPKDLPVLEISPSEGRPGMFQITAEVVDMVRRPPGLEFAKRAFCISVLTNAMEPALRQRSIHPVNPSQSAAAGDDAVIEFRPIEGQGRGDSAIKRIVAWEPEHVVVCQFNPPMEDRYSLNDIASVARIVPWGELMRG